MTTDPGATELTSLRAVAELLGTLLLRELEPPDLERLRRTDVARALADLDVLLPAPADEASWLEERAADFHDLFLRPDAGPLVQSLWTQGRYEGDATVRVRQLAEHAGVAFRRSAARGAPVDHLGCVLLLWSETSVHAPDVADEIAEHHLRWAAPALERIEARAGFYGAVAGVTRALARDLSDRAVRRSHAGQ